MSLVLIREDDEMILIMEVMLVETDKVINSHRAAEFAERLWVEVQHGVEDVFGHAVRSFLRPGCHKGLVEGSNHGHGSLDGGPKKITKGVIGAGGRLAG